jgi:hypothetical protein
MGRRGGIGPVEELVGCHFPEYHTLALGEASSSLSASFLALGEASLPQVVGEGTRGTNYFLIFLLHFFVRPSNIILNSFLKFGLILNVLNIFR